MVKIDYLQVLHKISADFLGDTTKNTYICIANTIQYVNHNVI